MTFALKDLKELGMTENDIIERVVEKIADQMLYGKTADLDYDETVEGGSTNFRKAVDQLLKTKIDEAIANVANKHTVPQLEEFIEQFCIKETNAYGEKKGEDKTFIEYLTARADVWLKEQVNHNGKSEAEDSYSWRANTTRAAYLVDSHLQYSISTALKNALNEINKQIAEGLDGAVKIQLKQALDNLKVTTIAKTR